MMLTICEEDTTAMTKASPNNQHDAMMRVMGMMICENGRRISQMKSLVKQGGSASFPHFPQTPMTVTSRRQTAPPARPSACEMPKRPSVQKAQQVASRPKIGEKPHTSLSKELEALLDSSRYTASSISKDDLHHIIGLYGSSVEDIFEPGAGQMWMLEEAEHVSSAFFLQILTKAVIDFDLPAFRQQADLVCRRHENLRSAFVCHGVEHPWRVVLGDRHPEINCFDLSDLPMDEFDERIQKLMEADRQRGFDLERDSLLRINIYKSCEKDTYAIIISQPHVNSDGTSLGILFSDLFIGYVLDMNGIDKQIEAQSYQEYAQHLSSVDTEGELEFWKSYLADAAQDQLLPGQQPSELDYDIAALTVPFGEKGQQALKDAQRAYRVTQFTLLQGLWGIMCARLKRRGQIVFGAITSGRDAQVGDSMRLAGGFVNALPVKVAFAEDESLADFLRRLQGEFARCMASSHCSPGQIRKALGRREPVFAHILNNHNFAKPKATGGFSQGGFTGIKMLGGDVYDNLSADLCVYFTDVEGGPGCRYVYNARAFSNDVIQLLSHYFASMLAALPSLGDDATIAALPSFDASAILTAESARHLEQVKIAEALKAHPVFQGADDEELLALAARSRLAHYPGDAIIVPRNELPREMPILLSGRVYHYTQARDGWENPLRLLREGDILSYSVLFEGQRTSDLIVNHRSKATVIWLPQAELLAFLAAHPAGMIEIARRLHSDKRVYARLWTNAE